MPLRPLAVFSHFVLLGLFAGLARAGPEPAEIAKPRDIEHIVAQAMQLVARAGHARCTIVFDQVSFTPPPGELSEFSCRHDFGDDLEEWIAELDTHRESLPCEVFVAGSEMAAAPLEGLSWADTFLAESTKWWRRNEAFSPADRWINRLLAPVEGTQVLVFVVGHRFPEVIDGLGPVAPESRSWRKRLIEAGQYWNAASIQRRLERARCSLIVVGPSADLGLEQPERTVPEVSWASRPQEPYRHLLPGATWPWPGLIRFRHCSMSPWTSGRVHLVGGTHLPLLLSRRDMEGRYFGATPQWFPNIGQARWTSNHIPSGFPPWRLAQVLTAVKGTFIAYPEGRRWLDDTHYSEAALARLPPQVTQGSLAQSLQGSPSYDVMWRTAARLSDIVIPPSAIEIRASRDLAPWVSAAPLRRSSAWHPHQLPADKVIQGYVRELPRAHGLVERTLSAYMEVLDEIDAFKEAEAAQGYSRARADLLLYRYWIAVGSFHLRALAEAIGAVTDQDGPQGSVHPIYIPAIRFSDCYPGWGGRAAPKALSPEDVTTLQRWEPLPRAEEPWPLLPGLPDMEDVAPLPRRWDQGNLLVIPWNDPRYRALRPRETVLERLAPSLRPPAERMIEAGADVIAEFAGTPWAATVYYNDALTFYFRP